MARVKPTKQKTNNGANVGYEAELWQMADALRGSMGAAATNQGRTARLAEEWDRFIWQAVRGGTSMGAQKWRLFYAVIHPTSAERCRRT